MKLKTYQIGGIHILNGTKDDVNYIPHFSYRFVLTPHVSIKGYRSFLIEWFKKAFIFEFPVKR